MGCAELPGPRRLPFVGKVLQLTPGRLHRQLEAWVEHDGSAFQLRFGRRRRSAWGRSGCASG